MLQKDFEPVEERVLLIKILTDGAVAKFVLVRHRGEFKAVLYVNGKPIPGPDLPQPLTPPKDEITHWMGNKPGVGLTTEQAEMITGVVNERNERLARFRVSTPEEPKPKKKRRLFRR